MERGKEHSVECKRSSLQYSDISHIIHIGGEESSSAPHNRESRGF